MSESDTTKPQTPILEEPGSDDVPPTAEDYSSRPPLLGSKELEGDTAGPHAPMSDGDGPQPHTLDSVEELGNVVSRLYIPGTYTIQDNGEDTGSHTPGDDEVGIHHYLHTHKEIHTDPTPKEEILLDHMTKKGTHQTRTYTAVMHQDLTH